MGSGSLGTEAEMIEKLLSFDIAISKEVKLSKIFLVTGALISMLWAGYFAIVILNMPHQLTYLEGAANVQTWFFLNRENPFSLENHPVGTNNYGFLYSLITLPFATLFGNTLLVHRAVTLGFVTLSALLTFGIIFRIKKDHALAAICSSFIVVSLMGQQGMGGISAYPSSTGAFFYITAILIPLAGSFSNRSLFVSILATLAGFYTKPYFLLSFVIVALYIFLFVSPKKGLLYGFFFFGFLFFSILFVKRIFPMYFIDVIWGNIFNTYSFFGHMLEQIWGLIVTFLPIIVLTAFILAEKWKNTTKEKISFTLSWDNPLVKNPPGYFLHSLLVSLIAFISVLGWHALNQFGYSYQLVLPLFFCWLFGEAIPRHKAGLFVAIVMIINLFSWERVALHPSYLIEKSSKEWSQMQEHLQNAKSVFHPPLIATDIISLGMPPIDSGHTIMFYNIQKYPDSILSDISYERARRDGYGFTTSINRRIENHKYDLIITVKDKAAFFDYQTLQQNYILVDEIKIEMNMGGVYTLQIWKPNP